MTGIKLKDLKNLKTDLRIEATFSCYDQRVMKFCVTTHKLYTFYYIFLLLV